MYKALLIPHYKSEMTHTISFFLFLFALLLGLFQVNSPVLQQRVKEKKKKKSGVGRKKIIHNIIIVKS